MRKLSTILALVFFSLNIISVAQTQIFKDTFTGGVVDSKWGVFWPGEDRIQAVEMSSVPSPLPDGGDHVGYLQDIDGSYTGSAQSVVDEIVSVDYAVEADVYCYVNHPEGSAYTGIVVHSDSSQNTYIKMVADFDANQRIRLYNNHLDFTTFQYSFHHEYTAADFPSGIPTEDGWHQMRLEARVIDENTTAYTCYFDGEMLGDGPVLDTSDDRMTAGRFGVFAFQQDADGIAGYFDNVTAEELPVELEFDFVDDFERGTPDPNWGIFWEGEDQLQAVHKTEAPGILINGGDYVGYLQDVDGSYTGSAQAVVDDMIAQDYSVEADVYCYVNHPEGSAYTGIVVHSDSSVNTYIKMVADFDANQRIRLYNNHLDFTTFQYSFHHEFTAADFPRGVPTEDGWHHMKMEARVVDDNTTAYWCYFDGELLGNGPVFDTSEDRMTAGRYGVFAFQQDADGIPGYFDNFKMKKLDPITGVDDEEVEIHSVPQEFALKQNYPNPFNPSTTIAYELNAPDQVSLVIYDVLGNRVKELVSEYQSAGYHSVTWNGTNELGTKVNSGFYVYTLQSGQLLESRKMILMK